MGWMGGGIDLGMWGGNPLSYVDPLGLMEITARKLPSGEYAGDYRYTFSFDCGPNCVDLEHGFDSLSAGKFFSWLKRMKNAQNKLRMSAGLKDVVDFKDRMACSRYEEYLEEEFLKRGYTAGQLTGTGLTEVQAREFLREAGKSLPFEIRQKYNWDGLIDLAKDRAPPSASDILR